MGGQVIWASRFKEKSSEQSSGKGGPKYVNYTYSVSVAIALCQGPITRLDRVWANGEQVALSNYNWRLYRGDETQLPDPLIEAIEGSDETPAFRGTAYIVFEDLPLDAFGNRLPQFSFEVVRAGDGSEHSLSQTVQGVNIIPASGEFVYATSVIRERRFPGIERPLNMNNSHGGADFSISLDQLQSDLPRVDHAALTVGWFGIDLRAGSCTIRPGVELKDRSTVPYSWKVGAFDRDTAYLISQTDGSPNYGGTPADDAVLEGIAALKAAGIAVTLSPFLFMDVPEENGLPDPYGGDEQLPFPWRGRITVGADGTRAAREEIEAFVGEDGGHGFRNFILHHARLAKRAGGVEAILIGSEMATLTRIRDHQGRFPFAEALTSIANEVKAIVGPSVKVSYAADWTEYGAYAPGDGSGDVLFPLDQLWASDAISYIGVDWYPPAGDWRDGSSHLDALAGAESAASPDYIEANLAGGEAFDWYYANDADREDQVRTAIVDTAHGEDWIFRQKDILGWWRNQHHARLGGVRATQNTGWIPSSKPIRLIEIGFPAVDKGTNSPNLFYDPKSSESAVPPFSSGARDDVIQRRALSVALRYWLGQDGVDQALVWAWDGRPWPDFPSRLDVWSDGPNWNFGHWLNGRTGLIELADILDDMSVAAGIVLDTRGVNGVVDGFVIDDVMSFASAANTLSVAYNFYIKEGAGILIAESEDRSNSLSFESARVLDPGAVETVPLLDKQPSGLALTHISGDFSYQPAITTKRNSAADRDFMAQASLPLVLTEGHAQLIAQDLYQRLTDLNECRVSFGPGAASGLEIGDLVVFDDRTLRVARIEAEGLKMHAQFRSAAINSSPFLALEPPDPGNVAAQAATPELQIIDGPLRAPDAGTGLVAAIAADPWTMAVPVRSGPSATNMSARTSAASSAKIGTLLSDLLSGPLGRWDQANQVHIYLPGGDLSSVEGDSVLDGRNWLLVQNDDGWELLGWRTAELVGADEWILRDLLRGLNGSTVRRVDTGSVVVLSDASLLEIPLQSDELGLDYYWQAGEADPQSFTYQDRAGLPWRVGHLSAVRSGEHIRVSWTARGAHYPNGWVAADPINALSFQVTTRLHEQVTSHPVQTDSNFELSYGAADQISVARIGTDQRRGEWVSIPLPSP
ncbi:MAG: glycoside hydrolase TIM-barrel-like domain-containing protein [Henriciella sp.]